MGQVFVSWNDFVRLFILYPGNKMGYDAMDYYDYSELSPMKFIFQDCLEQCHSLEVYEE